MVGIHIAFRHLLGTMVTHRCPPACPTTVVLIVVRTAARAIFRAFVGLIIKLGRVGRATGEGPYVVVFGARDVKQRRVLKPRVLPVDRTG